MQPPKETNEEQASTETAGTSLQPLPQKKLALGSYRILFLHLLLKIIPVVERPGDMAQFAEYSPSMREAQGSIPRSRQICGGMHLHLGGGAIGISVSRSSLTT